jgi:DNA-binding beta-propeller fold protein YncE
VQCERSPDGSRVAFIEDRRFEFGNTLPSQILHWFSINQPGYMETPLPEADTTRFAFSPDSNYLAVQASNYVSLIDLRNNQVTNLLRQTNVDVLAFSDNGRYLGVLLRPTSDGHSGRYWIIDTKAKQVLDAGPFDFQSSNELTNDNSIANIDFGKPINFGLENCR